MLYCIQQLIYIYYVVFKPIGYLIIFDKIGICRSTYSQNRFLKHFPLCWIFHLFCQIVLWNYILLWCQIFSILPYPLRLFDHFESCLHKSCLSDSDTRSKCRRWSLLEKLWFLAVFVWNWWQSCSLWSFHHSHIPENL